MTIIYYFYADTTPDWVKAVRNILIFYPPFNFSKAFGDIARKSSSHFNKENNNWEEGSYYSIDDLTDSIHGKNGTTNYDVPPTITSFGYLVMDTAVILLFTWFLDHVVEGNRGSADPVYFLFTRKYWGCKRKRDRDHVELPPLGRA